MNDIILDPARWPLNTANKVFVWRAINELGEYLYSGQWLATDMVSTATSEQEYNAWLDVIGIGAPLFGEPETSTLYKPLSEVAAERLGIIVEEVTTLTPISPFERYSTVANLIRGWCAEGVLDAFAFRKGHFERLPVESFVEEAQLARWLAEGGRVRGRDIAPYYVDNAPENWLFFDKLSFDKILAAARARADVRAAPALTGGQQTDAHNVTEEALPGNDRPLTGSPAFKMWYLAEINKSPSRRTFDRDAIVAKGVGFGLSATKTKQLRNSVLENLEQERPDVAAVWRKSGKVPNS